VTANIENKKKNVATPKLTAAALQTDVGSDLATASIAAAAPKPITTAAYMLKKHSNRRDDDKEQARTTQFTANPHTAGMAATPTQAYHGDAAD